MRTACSDYTVEIAAYDETGSPLSHRIESVVPVQFLDMERSDPGWSRRQGFTPSIQGRVISGLEANDYLAYLRLSGGKRETVRFTAYHSCQQRVSVVIRQQKLMGFIGDVAHEVVVGRLNGCRNAGDWWVRVLPMHGQPSMAFEGHVRTDGSFEVPGHFDRSRHILVVGFGREVIESRAIDLNNADHALDVGEIDIRKKCPGGGEQSGE
jgi:hypothetical protein